MIREKTQTTGFSNLNIKHKSFMTFSQLVHMCWGRYNETETHTYQLREIQWCSLCGKMKKC